MMSPLMLAPPSPQGELANTSTQTGSTPIHPTFWVVLQALTAQVWLLVQREPAPQQVSSPPPRLVSLAL
jgi:hypothetical protein